MNTFFGTCALLFVTTLLFGCGGGGDGGNDTTPTPPSSGATITSASAVTIAQARSDVSTTVTWNVTGTPSSVIQVTLGDMNKSGAVSGRDYIVIGTGASGSAEVSFTNGINDLYVYDGAGPGVVLAHKQVTATCDQMSTWGAAKVCAPNAGWNYESFVLTIYTDNCGKLGWVDFGSQTADKVKELVNKTGHNEKNVGCPIGLGYLPLAADDSLVVLPDGLPLVSMVTAGDANTRRWFPINPITKEILPEWTGTVPTSIVQIQGSGYGTWNDTPYAGNNIGKKGMYTVTPSGGIVYYTNDNSRELRHTTDQFQSYTVLSDRSSILGGGYKFIISVKRR